MIDRFVVLLLAYIICLLQVGGIGVWPLGGGYPNLLALTAGLFPAIGRPSDGLLWVVAGGLFLDLLSPAPFGLILGPIAIGYLVVFGLFRRLPDALPFARTFLACLLVLFLASLPLAVWSQGWQQLVRDLLAGALIAVPLSFMVDQHLQPFVRGLRIHAQSARRPRVSV